MKSLSERIADSALKNSYGRNDRNRAAFILVRGDVSKAVDDGYSLLSIWETLCEEGRIPYTYQTFRRYARVLLPPRPGWLERWTSK
ncbi:TraK family protein [Actimicrobium sp. CCC2.4]|uniref:TraK family protein n=1 Tax=Actimicrobium sp. CCC2.4 TaxID=3048606 RepID=UPI002AC95380|nr:TraK family protein [Actimicrobium sp. CCC2.4]MEB0134563.1 TraK family protein [Actimicrobium sp. CCC2.4]WPX34005.1 TraK family protein [Actimicrobium sp. CCC2.4]